MRILYSLVRFFDDKLLFIFKLYLIPSYIPNIFIKIQINKHFYINTKNKTDVII